MAEGKRSVKLYEREIRALLECDDASLARIIRAILCESLDIEPPETEKGTERGLYLTILGQVKSARELSEKRKISGSKGGRPKKPLKIPKKSPNRRKRPLSTVVLPSFGRHIRKKSRKRQLSRFGKGSSRLKSSPIR